MRRQGDLSYFEAHSFPLARLDIAMDRIPRLETLRSELRALKADVELGGVAFISGTLESPGLSDSQITELERALDHNLPSTFKLFSQTYDLSRFEMGETSFGNDRNYFDELMWLNFGTTWWCGSPWVSPEASRKAPRPQHLIMIAQGDPLSWLLDLSDGRVLGLDVEKHYADAIPAAHDLEQFVRCRTALWLAGVHGRATEQLKAEVLSNTAGDPRAWAI